LGVEFALYGVRESYVLSAAGRILHRHAGPVPPEILAQDFRALLR